MISKRTYFSITIMMVVLLFLFQFSMVVREYRNEYDINDYLVERQNDGANAWTMEEKDIGKEEVLFVGNEGGQMQNIVKQWCAYKKKSYAVSGSLSGYLEDARTEPELIVLESEQKILGEEFTFLEDMTRRGVTIVFGSIEDIASIQENPQLQEMMGIESLMEEEIKVSGIQMTDGFLLGGELNYQAQNATEEVEKQDLVLNMPWYRTVSGTKVYMVGMMEDYDMENELLPPVIWRNRVGDSGIFVVNGNYMKNIVGLGILDAMVAESSEYTIYPVVNAQSLSVLNFPGFAEENNELMESMYNRSQLGFYRDIIWPGLISAAEQNGFQMTCFVMPQFDYLDNVEPSGDELLFYLKQFKEVGAEAGISLQYIKGVSLADKLKRDQEFINSLNSNYAYGAVFAQEGKVSFLESRLNTPLLKNVGTILSEYSDRRPVIDYYSESVTFQSLTSDAMHHTFEDDLQMRSLQTCLGYSNIMLDMKKISWPQTEQERWEDLYKEFSGNLNTYWKEFQYYDKVTASECNRRIRKFLNLDYEHAKKGNTISLYLQNAEGENWFILRTHGKEVEKVEGGSWQKLEENAYLIQTEDKKLEITLKDSGLYYYLP